MVKHTQTIRRQQLTDCLSVFDHFVWLGLKELTIKSMNSDLIQPSELVNVTDLIASLCDMVFCSTKVFKVHMATPT